MKGCGCWMARTKIKKKVICAYHNNDLLYYGCTSETCRSEHVRPSMIILHRDPSGNSVLYQCTLCGNSSIGVERGSKSDLLVYDKNGKTICPHVCRHPSKI